MDLAAGAGRRRLSTQLLGKKSVRVGCRALQGFYNAETEIHLDTDLPEKATAELGVSWRRERRTMVHRQKTE